MSLVPSIAPKPKVLSATADNFFKIKVGEDAPFYGAAHGGVKPYAFEWDFGDGGVSNLQNTTHAYTKEGRYRVTLTVTDSAGTLVDLARDADVYPPNANFARRSDLRR